VRHRNADQRDSINEQTRPEQEPLTATGPSPPHPPPPPPERHQSRQGPACAHEQKYAQCAQAQAVARPSRGSASDRKKDHWINHDKKDCPSRKDRTQDQTEMHKGHKGPAKIARTDATTNAGTKSSLSCQFQLHPEKAMNRSEFPVALVSGCCFNSLGKSNRCGRRNFHGRAR